jgi:histidine triad (HIT) family protein
MAESRGMNECVFCGVVAGTVRRRLVDEDEWTVAFLDRSQVTDGHTLVVPKRHASDIWDITPEEMSRVAVAVHRVAGVLRERLDPAGLTLFQANRSAGWQDVFHLHVHVVPRHRGDRLVLPWRVPRTEPAVLDGVLARIRPDRTS